MCVYICNVYICVYMLMYTYMYIENVYMCVYICLYTHIEW